MKKILLSLVAMIGAFTANAEVTTTNLWEGTQALSYGTAAPSISADKCKDFKAGGEIQITFACGDENDWGGDINLIDATATPWGNFSWGATGIGVSLIQKNISFKLKEEDATKMATTGFALIGQNIIVSKIDYVEGIDPYLLWEGNETIDYTEKIIIPADRCQNMQANQQIIFYFTTAPGASYTQLGLIRPSWQAWASGKSWEQYPSIGSTSCVFDILEDNLAQIKQGGFRVIGNGIQLTKVMWKDQVRDKTVILDEPLEVNTPSQEIAITYDQLVAAQAVVGSGLQIEYEALEGEPESGQHFKFFHQGNADNEYEWIEFTDLQTVNSEGKSILILNRTTMDEINSYHKTLILQVGYAKINKIKTITALDIPGTAIMLDQTEAEIRMDQTLQLNATVRPADLFVSWTSSDESIATVDANGLVTPVAPGKAIITAAAGTAKATCEVTVNPLLGINLVWGKLSWQKPIWGEGADIRVPINPCYSPRLYIYTTGNEPVSVTYTMDPEKALTIYNYATRADGNAVGAMEVSSSSKAGKVTFEIALKNYPDVKVTATCEIYVPEKPSLCFKYYSSSDVLDPSIPLMIGQMTQISAEVEGDPNDSYSWRANTAWTSSDPSVIFVSEDGELLPLKRGKATITCVLSQANLDDVTDSIEFTVQEGGELSEYFQLTESSRGTTAWSSIYNFPEDGDPTDLSTFVFKKNSYTYTVEGNEIIPEEAPLIELTTSAGGATTRYAFPVFPEGAVLTFKAMQPGCYIKSVYRSNQYNNPKNSLKELPASGAVDNVWTAPGIGVEEAKLTLTKEVKCSEGPYWFVELVKYGTLSGVEISKTEIEGIIDGSEQLSATITPSDAAPAEITWTSSDEKVATVDATGLVKFIGEGTATITAAVGDFKAECKVTVKRPAPEAIALDKTSYEGFEDTTVQLTATVTPEKANPVTITWTSSDEKVATVNAEGLVSLVAPGTATITAAVGELKAECAITVKKTLPEAITLDESAIEGFEGDTKQLTATVTPDKANPVTITWTSSDAEIATVDATGLVTLVKAGTATITAAVGDLKAECTVTVKKVDGITDITAEGGEATYYTIDGIRVDGQHLTPGIYIKHQAGKVEKILVK